MVSRDVHPKSKTSNASNDRGEVPLTPVAIAVPERQWLAPGQASGFPHPTVAMHSPRPHNVAQMTAAGQGSEGSLGFMYVHPRPTLNAHKLLRCCRRRCAAAHNTGTNNIAFIVVTLPLLLLYNLHHLDGDPVRSLVRPCTAHPISYIPSSPPRLLDSVNTPGRPIARDPTARPGPWDLETVCWSRCISSN